MKVFLMFHFYTYSKRKGFILYIVCALAIGLFILIASLNKFKSGAVLQLSKNVTQERMIVVAQGAINEALAAVKGGINDVNTAVGKAVKDFWASQKGAPAVIWSASFNESSLKVSKDIAAEHLGNKGNVSCDVTLFADEQIKASATNSYTGHMVIVGKVSCDGVKDAVKITEVHDIKVTDLSFPLLDKYAFFVKSFCPSINSKDKKFIIEGVKGKNKESYSFVYFGNRNYPSCNEFPQGGTKNPPVIFDLDFASEDKKLLGAFYKDDAELNLKDSEKKQLSKGQFFNTFSKDFKDYQSFFDPKKHFHNTRELEIAYLSLVESARQAFAANPAPESVAARIIQDYDRAGGQPQNADVFLSLLDELMPIWKYYYGYTDYNHIYPENDSSFGATPPFTGLISYFKEYSTKNKSKVRGGSMPEIFGEDRKRPVYVDGPVYVRFFKVGLLDQINLPFNYAGLSLNVPVTCVSCVWEKPGTGTFSSQPIGSLDGITSRFMSHPVDWLSINNFYFGPGENVDNKDNRISCGMLGYNVFHYLDPKLRTVSNYYMNASDFIKDRIKNINGEQVLDLDGISVIYGKDKAKLDLSSIKKYRGKGMIVSFLGNCVLGDLAPTDANVDYLKIWLMGGRFFVDETRSSAAIFASLISTFKSNDNSSTPSSHEGGFYTNKVPTTIMGNLIIDNLFDMRDKKYFKIIHDPKIYKCEYPVRVSVGGPKAEYILDYKGKD